MKSATLKAQRVPVPISRQSVRAALVAISIVSSPATARADQGLLPYTATVPRLGEGDSLRLDVFELWRYDSNLYRLQDGTTPPDSDRRSGFTTTTGVGVSFDKSYGLQRIVIDASVVRDHYVPQNNLDMTGTRFTSTYYWKVTPAITGDLIFDHSRLPTDFEFVGYRDRSDPQTTQRTRLDIDWRAGAAIHPRLTVYRIENKTEDPTFQVESSRSTVEEGSLVYQFRSENSIELYGNRRQGENIDQQDNPITLTNRHFSQTEYGMRAQWKSSGDATVYGRVAHLDRGAKTFAQRDFSGVVWNLDAYYQATGKTLVTLSTSKSLYSAETIFSSYYDEYLASISVMYSLTGKVTLRPGYNFRRQTYHGSVFATFDNLVEDTRYPSLQVDWAALRDVDLSLQISHSGRSSNAPTLQFSDRSASVFARFKF